MKTADKENVSRTLKEEPIVIRIGLLRCSIKPLTLNQIYEIGVHANNIKPIEVSEDGKINILQQMIEHGNDAKVLCDIFVICAYRKKIWRKLLGKYLRKRLKMEHIRELIQFLSGSFDVNFFLTSITFLKQIKKMTEPSTTPHGQLSEE